MVPSRRSAVRRALSSYSAPTGLRRRRKDVNGRLPPLIHPSPPSTYYRRHSSRYSHTYRPLVSPMHTPPFLLARTASASTPLALFPASSNCLRHCYVLEAATPVAHARIPLSNKTLLVELPELGKRAEGKGRGRRGEGRRSGGRCFLKNVCSLSNSLSHPPSQPITFFPVSSCPSSSLVSSSPFLPFIRLSFILPRSLLLTLLPFEICSPTPFFLTTHLSSSTFDPVQSSSCCFTFSPSF